MRFRSSAHSSAVLGLLGHPSVVGAYHAYEVGYKPNVLVHGGHPGTIRSCSADLPCLFGRFGVLQHHND